MDTRPCVADFVHDNTCPVCGNDLTKSACYHLPMYLDRLPRADLDALYSALSAQPCGRVFVTALIDKPSAKSWGYCAFIVFNGKDYDVHGTKHPPLRPDEVSDYFHRGDFGAVNCSLLNYENAVASALGVDFLRECRRLQIAPPSLAAHRLVGCWYLALRPRSLVRAEQLVFVHRVKRQILQLSHGPQAPACFDRVRARGMACLLNWVDPSLDVVQALVWATELTSEGQQRELVWQQRLRRDNGTPIEDQALRELYETALED